MSKNLEEFHKSVNNKNEKQKKKKEYLLDKKKIIINFFTTIIIIIILGIQEFNYCSNDYNLVKKWVKYKLNPVLGHDRNTIVFDPFVMMERNN